MEAERVVKIQETDGKTYIWRCLHHDRDLVESGHSVGLGIECFPGMCFDSTTRTWFPDSSELSCPKMSEISDDNTAEWYAELDRCLNSWELVPEGR